MMKSPERRVFLLVMMAVLVATSVAWNGYRGPDFWQHSRINDDSRQQSFVLYRAQDSALFPDDMIATYATYYLPPLYRGLFSGVCRYADPVDAGKVTHLALFAASALLAALVGYRTAGPLGGVAAALMVLASPYFHDRVAGGLPRAFGFPIILAFLAAALWGRPRWCMAVVVLSAGFYPPATFILLPALVFVVASTPEAGGLKGSLVSASGVLFVGGLLGLLAWAAWRPEWIGPIVSRSEAALMPEWSRPGGRFPEFPWVVGWNPLVISVPLKRWVELDRFLAPAAMVAAAACAFLLSWPSRWRGRLPFEWKLFGVFALTLPVLFLISCAVAFHLFLPSRILEVALPPLAWVGAVVLPAALARERASRFVAGVIALAVAVTALGLSTTPRYPSYGYMLAPAPYVTLAAFVAGLGKDATIAGPPATMDYVPLMARRKVYVNSETAHPLYTGYYREISSRFTKLAQLYYATDRSTARRLADEEGVSHLVVYWADFDSAPSHFPAVFAPHGMTFAVAKSFGRDHFLFARPPAESVVFDNKAFQVIEIGRL